MTTKEYLTATLSKFQISENEIDLLMLNQKLEDGELSDLIAAKTAIYNEFSALIPLMDVSEGTMSIRWNLPALRMWYSLLAKELGKEDVLAGLAAKDDIVQDRSYLF